MSVDVHPLVPLMVNLAAGVYPPVDGLTETMPPPPGAAGAILSFTGHCVVAADVDPEWGASRCAPWDLPAPLNPRFQLDMAGRIGFYPSSLCLVLAGSGEPMAPPVALREIAADETHPRVGRAFRRRSEVRVFETADGTGLLIVGRGLAGRWEAGFARTLVPPGEGLFMQVAVGNIASLRAVQAAGFVPAGVEILFLKQEG